MYVGLPATPLRLHGTGCVHCLPNGYTHG